MVFPLPSNHLVFIQLIIILVFLLTLYCPFTVSSSPGQPTSQPTSRPTHFNVAKDKLVNTPVGLSLSSTESRGDGGPALSAVVNLPADVAMDSTGNIYLAEFYYIRMIDKATGIISTIAGQGSDTSDGALAFESFLVDVSSIDVSADGTVYFVERASCCVRRIDPVSKRIYVAVGQCMVCGFGGDGGPASAALLSNSLSAIYLREDAQPALYIADTNNQRLRVVYMLFGTISTIPSSGISSSSSGGSSGVVSSSLRSATLDSNPALAPYDVWVDVGNNVFIAEKDNCIVRRLDASTSTLSIVLGRAGICESIPLNGPSIATNVTISSPYGVCGDHQYLYVTFYDSSGILRIDLSSGPASGDYVVERITGFSDATLIAANMRASSNRFSFGVGCVAQHGDLIAPSRDRHRVLLIRGSSGNLESVVGYMSGVAVPAANVYLHPYIQSMWINSVSGDMYLADGSSGNPEPRIHVVEATTQLLSVYAGSGFGGYSGEGQVATLASMSPMSVVGDSLGNLYIAEGAVGRIRRIGVTTALSQGTIVTIAGNGDFSRGCFQPLVSSDAATSISLCSPVALAIDSMANLYIADSIRPHVRQLSLSTGIVSILVGTGVSGYVENVALTSARFSTSIGLTVSSKGDIYIADATRHVVLLANVTANKLVRVAGTPSLSGYTSEDLPATRSTLTSPSSVCVDQAGNIYIPERTSGRVRVVRGDTGRMSTFVGYGNPTAVGSDNIPSLSTQIMRVTACQARGNLLYYAEQLSTVARVLTGFSRIRRIYDLFPTSQPTGSPTCQPSGQPSAYPTGQPSYKPSDQPSCQPSRQPSAQPSCRPSRNPSTQPTSQPTLQPSCQPTAFPSSPSSQPSRRSSAQPTVQPIVRPSQFSPLPTSQPTGQPSSKFTIESSSHPSSCQPSAQPTRSPATQPFSLPTFQPSSQPTTQPTIQPTMQPTFQPSCQPSSQPSRIPTRQPSIQSTYLPTRQLSNVPSLQPTTYLTKFEPSVSPSHTIAPVTLPPSSNSPSLYPFPASSAIPSMRSSTFPTLPVFAPTAARVVNASIATDMLSSVSSNQTVISVVTETVRVVSQFIYSNDNQTFIMLPVRESEMAQQASGNLSLPSISILTNSSAAGGNRTYVAVAVASSTLWPSVNNSTLKPAVGQLQSDVVAVIVIGNNISKYVEVNFPPGATTPLAIAPPINFTIICPPKLLVQRSYTCNDTGYVETVQCKGVSGVYKGTCPKLAQTCASLNLNSLTVDANNLCQTVRNNSSAASGITCRCGFGPGATSDTGSVAAGVVIGLVSSDLSNTFKASLSLGSGSAAAGAIVLSMFSSLWGLGIIVSLFVWHSFRLKAKTIDEVSMSGVKQVASESVSLVRHRSSRRLRRALVDYINVLFPAAFVSTSMLEGIGSEVFRHHMYINFFFRLHKSYSPILDVVKVVTLQGYLLFLLALLYDLNYPSDDGSCIAYATQEECLARKYAFDPSKSYCAWEPLNFEQLVDDGEFFQCAYADPQFSYTVATYVSLMLSLATCLVMDPLEFIMSLLASPTVDPLDEKIKEEGRREQLLRAVEGDSETVKQVEDRRASPVDIDIADIEKETRGVSQQAKTFRRLPLPVFILNGEFQRLNADGSPISTISEQSYQSAEEALKLLKRDVEGHRLELLENNQEEDKRVFDAAWCIERDTGNFMTLHTLVKQGRGRQREVTVDVQSMVLDELHDVIVARDQVTSDLQMYDHAERGFEVMIQFIIDLLGRKTVFARIYSMKMELEYERIYRLSLRAKLWISAGLLSLNVFFLYFTLLRGISKGFAWQQSYLQSWALQVILDVFVFETLQCIWFHYFIPSLGRDEVCNARETVLHTMQGVLCTSHSKHSRAKHHKPPVVQQQMQSALNTSTYFFVSHPLALQFAQSFESLVVLTYRTVLPGAYGYLWQKQVYKSLLALGKQTSLLKDQDSAVLQRVQRLRQILGYHGLALSKRASRPSSVASQAYSLCMHVLRLPKRLLVYCLLKVVIPAPLHVQSVIIRVSEPLLLSGVWFFVVFIAQKPLYIILFCAFALLSLISLVWSYWKERRERREAFEVGVDKVENMQQPVQTVEENREVCVQGETDAILGTEDDDAIPPPPITTPPPISSASYSLPPPP
ncbi:hypothetical protein EON64_03180, partial [archaeon]